MNDPNNGKENKDGWYCPKNGSLALLKNVPRDHCQPKDGALKAKGCGWKPSGSSFSCGGSSKESRKKKLHGSCHQCPGTSRLQHWNHIQQLFDGRSCTLEPGTRKSTADPNWAWQVLILVMHGHQLTPAYNHYNPLPWLSDLSECWGYQPQKRYGEVHNCKSLQWREFMMHSLKGHPFSI